MKQSYNSNSVYVHNRDVFINELSKIHMGCLLNSVYIVDFLCRTMFQTLILVLHSKDQNFSRNLWQPYL